MVYTTVSEPVNVVMTLQFVSDGQWQEFAPFVGATERLRSGHVRQGVHGR